MNWVRIQSKGTELVTERERTLGSQLLENKMRQVLGQVPVTLLHPLLTTVDQRHW